MSAPAIAIDRNFATVLAGTYDAPAVDETKGLIAEAALRVYAKTADRLQPNRQRLHHYDRELKPVTHFVPPSYAKQHKAEDMEASAEAITRTIQDSSAVVKDERALVKQVADALVVDFGHYKSTHKAIARIAGSSPKTAENWTAAVSAPSLIYFLRLLPHSPSLRKLIAMEQDCDPGFSRELIQLMQKYVR
jgi:hypothetical protein